MSLHTRPAPYKSCSLKSALKYTTKQEKSYEGAVTHIFLLYLCLAVGLCAL